MRIQVANERAGKHYDYYRRIFDRDIITVYGIAIAKGETKYLVGPTELVFRESECFQIVNRQLPPYWIFHSDKSSNNIFGKEFVYFGIAGIFDTRSTYEAYIDGSPIETNRINEQICLIDNFYSTI